MIKRLAGKSIGWLVKIGATLAGHRQRYLVR